MLHRFGSFELDERRFELRRKGKPVPLQSKVLETIAYLVKNPDRLVSKEELIAGPWKGTAVGDSALAQVIMMARRALDDRGKRSRFIETVRGKGYRFIAEVHTDPTSSRSNKRRPTPDAAGGGAEPDPEAAMSNDFLGRKSELKTLGDAARRAIEGHGTLVLLAGEPGIGKTSLLRRFSRSVPGIEVLWGRCWEGGGAPAFWPWLEIVRAYVDRHGEAASLMGRGAATIAHWMPDRSALRSELASPNADHESPQARFRTFDAVTRFLSRAAESRPLALVIDDLHAADDASVQLLQFMSRVLDGTRLLLAASFRDLEVRNRPTLSAFLSGPLANTVPITLTGLTEPEVGLLLGSAAGQRPPAAMVHRVFKATNGNPFLVGELGRTVLATATEGQLTKLKLDSFRVPDRIADIVRKRLKHLPSATLRTLSIASVMGRDFSLALLGKLCGDEGGPEGLEPALAEGIVQQSTATAGHHSFSHALVRETLYHELPVNRRRDLHFAAAELLEHGSVSDYAAVFQVAHHYFAASARKGADKALEWSLKAAHKAREILAFEQAAEHYVHALEALDLTGRDEARACEIELLLGDVQRLSGQSAEALATFGRVESVATLQRLDELVAKALICRAEVLRDAAGIEATLYRRIVEALDKLPAGDTTLRARLMAVSTLAGIFSRTFDENLAFCKKTLSMARKLGDLDTLGFALYWCHLATSQSSRPELALDFATEMVEVARKTPNAERLLDGYMYRAAHLLTLGRRGEADVALSDHARLAEEMHHALHLWWVRLGACMKALLVGNLEAAEAAATEARTLGLPLLGLAAESAFGIQVLAIGVEEEGAKKEREIRRAREVGEKMQQIVPSFRPWEAGLALAQLEDGSIDEARATFERIAAAGFDQLPDDHHRLAVLAVLARLAYGLEHAQGAGNLYRQMVRYAGHHVMISATAGYWGPASYYLGKLAVVMGQPAVARPHFEAALHESTTIGAPGWKAWAECELGTLLSQRNQAADPKRSGLLLRSALDTARRLGLERLARHAKLALRE